ncbi:MAG: CbiQ family ECF transporter T component [Acidimicrobiales bacterium]
MRRPRFSPLHPAAWWLWAGALAAAASRTTDPILLLLIIIVAAVVTINRRSSSPWARSYGVLLRFGGVVVVIRVAFQIVFGQRLPGHVIFSLPSVALPSFMAGVSLGGPVTIESIVAAACLGLQLAAILACVGAASALVSPFRLLRCVPAALYEVAVAVTVALTFTPAVVASIGRVREARRLRGRTTRGMRGLRGIAVPVLSGALEHSIDLAASMDARGFGRAAAATSRGQRVAPAVSLAGLVGIGIGVFSVLDGGAPSLLGLPVLALGAVLVALGIAARSHSRRTRYRPDRFGGREWLTAGSGAAALAGTLIVSSLHSGILQQQSYPLAMPAVPVVAFLGILLAAFPLAAAPAPAPGGGSAPAVSLPMVAEADT